MYIYIYYHIYEKYICIQYMYTAGIFICNFVESIAYIQI